MEQILNVLLEIKQEIEESLLTNKEVFSLQQFCKYADISEDHGYKLTRERKIKFYRPGGKKIYIDREDAIAYLRQNPVNSCASTDQQVDNYFLTSKTAA
ncbi:MAG: helix-turn-helix domain-containing protein [Ginsengibacter sp.]